MDAHKGRVILPEYLHKPVHEEGQEDQAHLDDDVQFHLLDPSDEHLPFHCALDRAVHSCRVYGTIP